MSPTGEVPGPTEVLPGAFRLPGESRHESLHGSHPVLDRGLTTKGLDRLKPAEALHWLRVDMS